MSFFNKKIKINKLFVTTTLATALGSLPFYVLAAEYRGLDEAFGPFNDYSDSDSFYDRSVLNANTTDAVSGGSQQNFYDSSVLNANATYAVGGGWQNFYDNSVLNVNTANAFRVGSQNFYDNSVVNARVSDALSDGADMSFLGSSQLNATASNAISGGLLSFGSGSKLNATASNAISGGLLSFGSGSKLNAIVSNAISGGKLFFNYGSQLNATASNAISGGELTVQGTGELNASATNAISGGKVTLLDSGVLNILAENALTTNVKIELETEVMDKGSGTIRLNGYSTVVGGIRSLMTIACPLDCFLWTEPGVIENGGSDDSTLTVHMATVDDATFYGTIQNGGIGTLSLVKAGLGTLILLGDNTYTGGTILNGGNLQAGDGSSFVNNTAYTVNAGTLDLNDYNLTMSSLAGGGGIVMSGTGELTIEQTENTRYAGKIKGTGAFVKDGTGTLTLTGASSSVGAVTVEAGALVLGQDGKFNASSLKTKSGATTTIADTAQLVLSDAFIQNTDSTLTISVGSNTPVITASSARLNGTINISGINGPSNLDQLLIATTSGINGDYTSVSIGGSVEGVDYLTVNTKKSADGLKYFASYNLSWMANNTLSHGIFTLTNATDSFDVGVALTDQTANVTTNWDGKSLIKEGAGMLTLSGVNTYTGTTTINYGTLSIAVTGSIMSDVINQATFNNAGTIVGTLMQTGGITTNNGTITGTVTIDGGVFKGIGTSGDLMVNTGGTVAPGNSIGTMNVAGNVSFNTGSIYLVEIDATGQSDRINVTGAATLGNGTVHVLAGAGNYVSVSTYTILSSDQGIKGSFSNVSTNLAFLDPTLAYDSHKVYLTMLRNSISFADIGGTRNQIAAGSGTQSLGVESPIYSAVLNLSVQQARQAFDSLSGEIHASIKTALLDDSRFVREISNDRIRAAFGGIGVSCAPVMTHCSNKTSPAPVASASSAAWAQGFGSWGHHNSDGNAARLNHNTGGILMGVDALVRERWRVGVIAGYSYTSFEKPERASLGNSDSYHLGLYTGTQSEQLGFRSGLAYSWHNILTTRAVAFPRYGDNLKANYKARSVQVFGELAHRIDTSLALIEPFANLAYVSLHNDSINEQGGMAAISGDDQNTSATFSTLGLHASTSVSLGGINATVRGSLGWRHAFDNTVPLSTQGFATGQSFTIAGTPITKNATAIEIGLNMRFIKTGIFSLSYNGLLANNTKQHGLRVNFGVKF